MPPRAFVSDCLVVEPVEGGQVVARQWEEQLPSGSVVVRLTAGAGGVRLLLSPRLLLRLRRSGVAQVDVLMHSGLTHALALNALLVRFAVGARVTLVVLQRHRRIPWPVARLLRGFTTMVVANEQDRIDLSGWGLRATVLDPAASPERVARVDRAQARRRLGLPETGTIFLHVGHGTPGRNLGALAPLAQQGTLALVLSPYSDLHRGAVPSGDRVVVVHERVDVSVWYAAADVYVFPTVDSHASIAVPMSVVEAVANGLPVVARRSAMTSRWEGSDGVRLVDDDAALVSVAREAARPRLP